MSVVVGLIAALVGAAGVAYYQYKRNQGAQALNSNLESKEEVQNVQRNVDNNDALIAAEKEKQTELQKKADEEKTKDVSKDDLLNFFNCDNK